MGHWSSTADLLNQPNGGPSGSHFYPQTCQAIPDFVAHDIARGADGPVSTTNFREPVTLNLDGSGDPIQRPFLGNTSMESYDPSNCLGCHAKSYVDGYCSLDNSLSCTDDNECAPGTGPCQSAGVTSTDLMYFLKLEVANTPALRLARTSLSLLDFPDHRSRRGRSDRRGRTDSWITWRSESSNVVLGLPGSSRDPRCDGIAVCRDISADPMGLPLSFRGATERACVDIRPDGYRPRGTVTARIDLIRADDSCAVETFDLPCQNWRLHRRQGTPPRLTYRDTRGKDGPLPVDHHRGGQARDGTVLVHDLLAVVGEHVPLQVVLSADKLRYCTAHRAMQWLGGRSFRSLHSENDAPPPTCAAPR
jgi:hypothetical protein